MSKNDNLNGLSLHSECEFGAFCTKRGCLLCHKEETPKVVSTKDCELCKASESK